MEMDFLDNETKAESDIQSQDGQETRVTQELTPTSMNPASSSGCSITSKRRRTSNVWNHFEMLSLTADNKPRARCRQCGAIYSCDSRNGTSNLNRHVRICIRKKNPDLGQMFLSQSGSLMSMKPPKFSLKVFREKMMMAILKHDLPFQFVEYEGIRDALGYINEGAKFVTRDTVEEDVLKIYHREKAKVRNLLHSIPGRISLTFDLWTSISTDEYLSLTAHFLEQNWKLQKRVLSFHFMSPPHTAIALSEKIYALLNEWGIERKLFSVTLDDASTNDLFVGELRNQLNLKNGLLCNGEFFHVRCCAHILNLIVQDGLKEIDSSVVDIRESVKYLKGSNQRRRKFLECVRLVSLETKKALRQDIPTRWNSTFLMLESALYYRRAFMHFAVIDPDYKHCPSHEEWERVEKLFKFLGVFYKVTDMFSGTQYPTSNLYFPQVLVVQDTLTKAMKEGDGFVHGMAVEMNKKFENYWSKSCVILAIAVVLDPRYKLRFVEWSYERLYGSGSSQINEVSEKLYSLFETYKQNSTNSLERTSKNLQKDVSHGTHRLPDFMEEFDTFSAENSSSSSSKSELDLYLDEQRSDWRKELDVLDFWRDNRYRFPCLSLMARDILSIPISTVSSEAAFNIGRRVVNKSRSVLKPEIVESTFCSHNWIFGKQCIFLNADDMEPDVNEMCEDVTMLNINDSLISVGES